MILPKIGKKLVLILLLIAVFFVSSPLVYAQAAPQVITTQKGADGQDYLLIPVSDLEQNPDTSQYRIRRTTATVGSQLEGGQVLGIFDVFGDIWDAVKKIGSTLDAVANCVTDAFKCGFEGLKAFFDFGSTAFAKFVLNMVGGDAPDCFIPSAPGGTRSDALNTQCQDIDAALLAIRRGEPIALDPARFGLIGVAAQTTTTALAMPVPMDSTTYLASINPFTEAQATAGTTELGNSTIVLDIWKKVRDGSYILLVVAVVIVGLMIMLRIPTGPRTAVTIQNSLPRIAISLLLITFSFLIGGLMIDGARIIGDLFQSFLPSISLVGATQGIGSILGLIVVFLLAVFSIASLIGTPILGVIVTIALLLLIVFALVAMFVIITFKLISRLVIFLLMVMFAPLFFLAGALPKGEAAIIFWFKRTAAALLAIPATGFVFSLALVIGSSGVSSFDLDFAADSGILGGTGGFAGVLVDMFSWAFAAPFIGLVLLSFAIKTPDIVDEMFGVKGFASRTGGLGMIFGAPGAAFKGVGGLGRSISGIQQGASTLGGLIGGNSRIKGWGGTPSPTKITGGTPVTDPKWGKALGKAGALNTAKIKGGIDVEKASGSYQNLLMKHNMVEQDAAGTLRSKEGTIHETKGGEIQQPTPKKPGLEGFMGRTAARLGFQRRGQKTPPQKPTFRTPKQISEGAAKAKDERAGDVRDASLGGNEGGSVDDD